jgi:hypothetical protein
MILKNKKILIFSLIIAFCVIVMLIISKNTGNNCFTNCENVSPLDKTITVNGYTGGQITFKMPQNWNSYFNGDPELLPNMQPIFDRRNIIESVSSSDRSVTLSDINWQQLDFYITDGDYIGSDYSLAIKNTESETMQAVQNDYFEGYSSTSILQPGETPSKANTGGTTYYLRPMIAEPKWNLIINKQALGDNGFETEVDAIINTLQFRLN